MYIGMQGEDLVSFFLLGILSTLEKYFFSLSLVDTQC